jgi:lysophospholipase L1-like esterase
LLIRSAFAGEPLFDIAAVEAMGDRGMSSFSADGETTLTLARENSADGAHLNARGRRRAAAALLDVLGQTIASQQ